MAKIFNWEKEIQNNELEECVNILKNKGIIVFPTETVYGIGANALEEEAVNKIYKAKGRQSDNPLIVHISEKEMIYDLVKEVNEMEGKLIEHFFPGPFTLILKKKEIVPGNVTANLDTVGIRMPNNKIANKLIKSCGFPIAAPSANISGKPSGTKIEDIKQELIDRVDAIIDGGTAEIGIESTVVKVIDGIPNILRPGKITPEEIKAVIGTVKMYEKPQNMEQVESPGMKYKHYAPDTKCMLITGTIEEKLNKIEKYATKNSIIIGKIKPKSGIKSIFYGNTLEEISRNIFTLLRTADQQKPDIILIEGVEETGLGIAIMNRLTRTCE